MSGKLSNCSTDWHQIWYISADSSGMDIAKYNSPLNTMAGISGGLRGHKFKSGKAAKQMERLAPNSVHVCQFIWEWQWT